MGLFETIFKKPKADVKTQGFYKMLNGYSPVFTNAPGSLYEMELIRTAIHSFATYCSKLKPEVSGTAAASLARILQFKPNPFQDTVKFIYRLATIYAVNNTAFIVPVEDEAGTLTGYFPILPQNVEVIDVGGLAFLRYTFANGQRAAIELGRAGLLTQFQYRDDFFGENNDAMKPTMQLIHAQNQGIIAGVKNSASIRFLAKVHGMLKDSDIDDARAKFTKDNLSGENESGVLVFDNKFDDVKQVESKPFTVNAPQMAQINSSVYAHFGTNENILQNKYSENEWNAYYEGVIEPFALQLSLVLSNMTFTDRELAHGNAITFSANRLQYASNDTKLNISTQGFDRGFFTLNEVMDIWNKPHVEGGDARYIRMEYENTNNQGSGGSSNANNQGQGVPGDGQAADGGGEPVPKD
jgi:hypothetical protein